MKSKFLYLLTLTVIFALTACDDTENGDQTTYEIDSLSSEKDQASYGIGMSLGKQFQGSGLDSLNLDLLKAGIQDVMNGNELQMTDEQANQAVQQYVMSQQMAAQQSADNQQQTPDQQGNTADAQANMERGMAFLEENVRKDGISETPSGLQYEVVEEGSGPSPDANDVVKVHYTGKLINGTVFDSSVERGEPAEFPLNQVIPGWTEGLQLMKEGGKYNFYIPSELAYGAQGPPSIGPNQTLIFEVELLEVQPSE